MAPVPRRGCSSSCSLRGHCLPNTDPGGRALPCVAVPASELHLCCLRCRALGSCTRSATVARFQNLTHIFLSLLKHNCQRFCAVVFILPPPSSVQTPDFDVIRHIDIAVDCRNDSITVRLWWQLPRRLKTDSAVVNCPHCLFWRDSTQGSSRRIRFFSSSCFAFFLCCRSLVGGVI